MTEKCKKCLLLEAGERVTYEEIRAYIDTLPKDTLVSENEYQRRLAFCKDCGQLLAGMCRACGCYVEVRARLKGQDCPDLNGKRW